MHRDRVGEKAVPAHGLSCRQNRAQRGQRPGSVLDEGSARAGNQGQAAAETLSRGSAEASAPTKPGAGVNGER